jgi:Cu(I)/Ag(I) efflux system protein CusF
MRASTLVLAATLALALALAVVGVAAAQTSMLMKDLPGMSMKPGMKHGQGTGVIKAINSHGGTLTIQHGPIPAVSWPAMTMTFKAKPALLKGHKAGQAIDFKCDVMGMSAEVTAVRPK